MEIGSSDGDRDYEGQHSGSRSCRASAKTTRVLALGVGRGTEGRGVTLDYVVALSRRHYEEIGFIPRPRLEQYESSGQVWTESENGELCGFLVWGNGWPVLRVYQVCIQYDARRREHGMRLVKRLIQKADSEGYESVSCWVADDIAANEFWEAAGFRFCGQRDGGRKRGRKHNRWVFWLPRPAQLLLVSERGETT